MLFINDCANGSINDKAIVFVGIHIAFFSGNEMFWKVRWLQEEVHEYSPIDLHALSTVFSTSGILYLLSDTLQNTKAFIKHSLLEPRIFICKKETIDLDNAHDIYSNSYITSNIQRNSKADDELLKTQWTGTFMDSRVYDDPQNSLTGQLFMVNGFRNDSLQVRYSDSVLRFWRQSNITKHLQNNNKHKHYKDYNNSQNTNNREVRFDNFTRDNFRSNNAYATSSGILGYEWDIFSDDCARPIGLIGLSYTYMKIEKQLLQVFGAAYGGSGYATHRLSLYRHMITDVVGINSSLVFGAGTIQWSWALCQIHDGYVPNLDYSLQQATVNLFADMGIQPLTLHLIPDLKRSQSSLDFLPPQSQVFHKLYTSVHSAYKRNSVVERTKRCPTYIVIEGRANDFGGGRVASVEVSVDNGKTWALTKGKEKWYIKYHVPSVKTFLLNNSDAEYFQILDDNKNCNKNRQNFNNTLPKYSNHSSKIIYSCDSYNISRYEKNTYLYDIKLFVVSRAVDDSGWIEESNNNYTEIIHKCIK